VSGPDDPRMQGFPSALRKVSRITTVETSAGSVPALLCHPDWQTPAPMVLWMHGRTVNKELDPGRYLRWIRAGIGAVAIDLPGHGERESDPESEASRSGARSIEVIEHTLPEIDAVVSNVAQGLGGNFEPGLFRDDAAAIGGMSLGGMIALRRLCDAHTFRCASVEGTTGWLSDLYFPTMVAPARPLPGAKRDPAQVAKAEAMANIGQWRPIPLLAMHSEADEVVPWAGQRAFLDALKSHYQAEGADPSMVVAHTWPQTGAPSEHSGFGRFASEARTIQTDFLSAHLKSEA